MPLVHAPFWGPAIPAPSPSLTSFFVLSTWPSEAALARFEETSPLVRSWASAREFLSVWMRPTRSHGRFLGGDPLAPAGSRGKPTGPAAQLTYVSIRNRHVPRFYRVLPSIVAQMREHGPALEDAFSPRLRPWRATAQPATFSLWPSGDEPLSFAYRAGTHQTTVRRSRKEDWFHESYFARLEVLRCTGVWRGTRPFGEDYVRAANAEGSAPVDAARREAAEPTA